MQNAIIITQKALDATPKPRLDSVLSVCLQIPRAQALQLIKHQQILLNDTLCTKASAQVALGDVLGVLTPHSQPQTRDYDSLEAITELKPEFLDIEILHQDSEFLVINKPPNIVIHEAPSLKEPTLVDWIKLTQSPIRNLCGDLRYGIVHRLDRQTSGALAIAKTPQAHNALSAQLKSRQMGRYYLALIANPLKKATIVECYLGRHPKNRLKMTKLTRHDARAHTGLRYSKSVFAPLLDCTHSRQSLQLVAVKLFTGRTHQIRAHLESLGRHIIGDTLYGYKGEFGEYRVLLHAYLMYVSHPKGSSILSQEHCLLSRFVKGVNPSCAPLRDHTASKSHYLDSLDSTTSLVAGDSDSIDSPLVFKAPLFADMIAFLERYFDKDKLNEVLSPRYILDCFA